MRSTSRIPVLGVYGRRAEETRRLPYSLELSHTTEQPYKRSSLVTAEILTGVCPISPIPTRLLSVYVVRHALPILACCIMHASLGY